MEQAGLYNYLTILWIAKHVWHYLKENIEDISQFFSQVSTGKSTQNGIHTCCVVFTFSPYINDHYFSFAESLVNGESLRG